MEAPFLARVHTALETAGLWDELQTEWAILDCEVLPWSAKAQELIRQQYAAVGAAARSALPSAVTSLKAAAERGLDVAGLVAHYQDRAAMAGRYSETYRRYCWPVLTIDDYRLAPFHLLATEGTVHCERDHVWHMEMLARVCRTDPEWLLATAYRIVDVTESASQAQGIAWWEELTGRGGEGMVVKPRDFVARGRRGIVQPAVKCRGRDYLRIIYGPEYTTAENMERLRARGLGVKRSMALREFALGIEGLERFVRHAPLHQIHECVFGVLALESEPVDPRL